MLHRDDILFFMIVSRLSPLLFRECIQDAVRSYLRSVTPHRILEKSKSLMSLLTLILEPGGRLFINAKALRNYHFDFVMRSLSMSLTALSH